MIFPSPRTQPQIKNLKLIVIACLSLAAFGVPAIAADGAAKPGASDQAKKPNRIDVLTEELGLSPEQKAAIGKLYKDESDQVKAIRADESLSKEDQNKRIGKIRTQLKADIRAQLTPEQAKKFDEKK